MSQVILSSGFNAYAVGTDTHAHQYTSDLDLSGGNNIWYVIGDLLNKVFHYWFAPENLKSNTKLVTRSTTFFASAERVEEPKTSITDSKCKIVYLVGPKNPHAKTISKAIVETGLPFMTIGNGMDDFSIDHLSDLKGKVSNTALIILDFHGSVDLQGDHLIDTHRPKGSGITPQDHGFSYTKDLFGNLTEVLYKKFNGHIYLGSCKGGAAIRAAQKLPKNALLSTHTNANTDTNIQLVRKDILLKIKEYPGYISNVSLLYPDELTFLHQSNNSRCTIRVPGNIPKSSDQVQNHIQKELENCPDEKIKHASNELVISEEQYERYLTELFILHATNKNKVVVNDFLSLKIVNPNVCLEDNVTALSIAARGNDYPIVNLLLNYDGTDPNKHSSDGATPLYCAAQNGYYQIAERLLQHKETNPNLQNLEGLIPLTVASQNGHLEILRLLLTPEYNPQINHQTEEGATPLFAAAANGQSEAVSILLILTDINPNLPLTRDGATPLYKACYDDRIEIVKMLIKHPQIDPNGDCNGETPLLTATFKNFTRIMKLLLKCKKTDPNIKNKEDDSPLLIASSSGLTEAVKLLLQNERINPNMITQKNISGRVYEVNPLYMAALNGHKDIVRLILNHSLTNPRMSLWDKNSPRNATRIASIKKHNEIADMIEQNADMIEQNAAERAKKKKDEL